MAVYQPTTESELRTILGYWDDSGASRVAGTADTVGDIVRLPPTTITASGADKQLSPKPGVHILGSGPTSILSGFGFKPNPNTTGGATVASAFANWTLDINGLAAAAGPASGNHGGATIEDVSFAAYRWIVKNSDAATAGGNNLTLTNLSTSTAVEGLMDLCNFSDANLDCLSTKGGGAGGNTSAVYRGFNCTIETPGTSASDNAATPHEGVPLNLYRCTLSGNSAGGDIAWIVAADGSEAQCTLANCIINGQITRAYVLDGCTVNLRGKRIDDNRTIRDSTITGSGNTTADYSLYYSSASPSGWTTTATVLRVSETGAGSGTGLFTASSAAVGLDIDSYSCTSKYRGLDLRNGASAHAIDDAAIDASQYGILWDATPGLTPADTVTNVVATIGGFKGAPSNPTGYTVQGDVDDEVAAYEAAVNVGQASQPAVTDGWSTAVLQAYEIAASSAGARSRARLRNRA